MRLLNFISIVTTATRLWEEYDKGIVSGLMSESLIDSLVQSGENKKVLEKHMFTASTSRM